MAQGDSSPSTRKGLFRRLFGRTDSTNVSSSTGSGKTSHAKDTKTTTTKNEAVKPVASANGTHNATSNGPNGTVNGSAKKGPPAKETSSPTAQAQVVPPGDKDTVAVSPAKSRTTIDENVSVQPVTSNGQAKPVTPAAVALAAEDPDFNKMFINNDKDKEIVTGKRTTSLSQDVKSKGVVHTEPPEVAVAQQLFNESATFIPKDEYTSWLGNGENSQVLKIYMSLFDFYGHDILSAIRLLCEKLYMRGESQQLNRIMEEFASAWVHANPSHGFGDKNVVYAIGYSFLLLNTDIYAADHSTTKKISKQAYVQNTLSTIVALDSSKQTQNSLSHEVIRKAASGDGSSSSSSSSATYANNSKNMVQKAPYKPFTQDWLKELGSILREFYTSISKEALKLSPADNKNNHISNNDSGRANSSLHDSGSRTNTLASMTNYSNDGPSAVVDVMLNNKPQSQSSLLGKMGFSRLRGGRNYEHESRIGTSSLDRFGNNNEFRNNSLRSTFSADTNFTSFGVSKHAVGFAGLLWNSMIKEEEDELAKFDDTDNDQDGPFSDFAKIQAELEKEIELELAGAPWAKEGISLYRPYIDPNTGKKTRKKDWLQVFTVVQRGQLKMFKFDQTSSSSSSKSKTLPGTVGSGNWMESANLVDGFHLCHTMAQEAPSPKRVKGFNGVWSLTLPQRGILVFRTGTPEIAQEFVYTCNYWAARLSKEPFDESISSMQFGWGVSPDPSGKVKYPGDRLTIKPWKPSGHSMVVSDLNEDLQLKNLQEYVRKAEQELADHNALRHKMIESFSPGSQNLSKALTNWERKSQYLLQQVIRYKVYADALDKALQDKGERFHDAESTV